jgi:molybdate transport system regulatory protein
VAGLAGDALGPGKAQLLEEVTRTGSLREAASRLEMSYLKAWRPAEAMNENFRAPLLEKTRGGNNREGTQLTELGQKALMTYQRMNSRAGQAAQIEWEALPALWGVNLEVRRALPAGALRFALRPDLVPSQPSLMEMQLLPPAS